MVTQSWMYDAIIYIYALSLLFYFSDFAGHNRRAKRMGTGLLIFVWVLQTIFFIVRMVGQRQMPILSMFDILFFFSWLLVTASLLLNRFFRVDLFVFFVNVIGFSVLALNFFSDPNVVPSLSYWNINDELLFIHISLAVCSYAAFAVGAVFAGMYLFLHRQLKSKHWGATMKRMPSLEKMDRYAYLMVVTGVPLLILSLSLGLVWVVLIGDIRLLLDPKVLNSLLILAIYGYYLIRRITLRSPGYRLAQWNLAAFAVVVVNFIISNFYSAFHQWIWG